MTETACRVCHCSITPGEVADSQVLVCPQCGYCIAVPEPWDRETADEACLAAIVQPGARFGSFEEERKAAQRKCTLGALLATPIGIFALYWTFQDQLLFWRLLSGVGAFWMLSSALILFIFGFDREKGELKASVVPLPTDPPRKFFELGRPICLLQEAPNASAVLLTVIIEILFAVASLVAGFAALLALREGVLSSKAFLLVLLAPLLSGLLLFHAVRLIYFPLRVWLFPEGLVRARGKNLSIQRWDRINTVSLEAIQLYTSTHHVLTLEDRNGQRLEFGKGVVDLSSRDLERLVQVVQSCTSGNPLPTSDR